MPEKETPLSPELRQFAAEMADAFAGRVSKETSELKMQMLGVQRDIARSQVEVQKHVDQKTEALARQVESVRVELRTEIAEVDSKVETVHREMREEIGEVKATQHEHGVKIARIEERLQQGEKEFTEIKGRVAAVETDSKNQGKAVVSLATYLPSAAGVAGAAGAGSAITWAVMNFLK